MIKDATLVQEYTNRTWNTAENTEIDSLVYDFQLNELGN